MTRVVCALVHYNNADDIRAAIARVRAIAVPRDWRVDVYVADNSGNAPDDLDAVVVTSKSNRGYLGGAAMLLDYWCDQHEREYPDWFVVINPDAHVDESAFRVLASTRLDPDVAIVAPSIRLGGITPQNPFLTNRPTRARMWLYTIAYRSTTLTCALDVLLWMKRALAGRKSLAPEPPRCIYAPHGSVVFIRGTFFRRGGTLTFEGFMFGEEIHLAEQIRQLSLSVLYLPPIRVVHRGGSTTMRVHTKQRRRWHLDSARVLWTKYFR